MTRTAPIDLDPALLAPAGVRGRDAPPTRIERGGQGRVALVTGPLPSRAVPASGFTRTHVPQSGDASTAASISGGNLDRWAEM